MCVQGGVEAALDSILHPIPYLVPRCNFGAALLRTLSRATTAATAAALLRLRNVNIKDEKVQGSDSGLAWG